MRDDIALGRLLFATALGLFVMGAAGLAIAEDRPPTADERTTVEGVLKNAGYTSWKKIEMDDGRWEADDAIAADGKQYDLDIDPKTMKIIGQKLENEKAK